MGHRLELLEHPGEFLEAAGDLLAAAPVEATVVATVAERMSREAAAGVPAPSGFPLWWLVVRDEAGAAVGAGMRTAPFAPHPVYLLRMPDAAARDLARTLHDRDEEVRGANGALPAAETFAAETARLTGGTVRVAEHTRLFELEELVEPPLPPGRLRLATEDDVDQALAWYLAFGVAAAEQAGRSEAHSGPHEDHDSMLRRIREREVWFWEDESGAPVHVTGANPATFGVARIGPVYTPKEHRGRGYASAAVAVVSRVLRDEGARVCLFTDQANPVSNALYERLGYRRVVDQAHLVIDRPDGG